jgi:hypothetical protein
MKRKFYIKLAGDKHRRRLLKWEQSSHLLIKMRIHVFVDLICRDDVVCIPVKNQIADKLSVLTREDVPVLPVLVIFACYLFVNLTTWFKLKLCLAKTITLLNDCFFDFFIAIWRHFF